MKKGWEYKKLGDIANDMYRGSGIKREQVTDTGIPCVRYGEIYTTYNIAFDKCASHTNEEIISSPKYFETGDILFAITGESVEEIGKSIAYLGKEKCMCGGDIVVVKHSQYPKYLSYALSSPKAIKQKGLGKTKLKVVHTNIPSLKEISIPVPPLSEQKEIVEYLDSSFAKIDKLKENAAKNLEEAKALFQSALKDALEPKEGWEMKTLKEVSLSITDGDHMPPPKANEGIPFVTISNIDKDSNTLSMKNTFYVPEDYYNNLKEERKPRKGDLLYTVTGSFGIPVVVDSNDRFCFQRHIAMIRPDNNKITSEFLYYWCLSPNAKMIADQVATGTAQRTVSLTSLRKFIIPIPSIKEQELLVSTLTTIEEKLNTLQQNYSRICDECDALKQAILRQVFE